MVFIYRSISPEYFVLPVPTLTSSTSKLSTVMNTSGYLHVNYRIKKNTKITSVMLKMMLSLFVTQ